MRCFAANSCSDGSARKRQKAKPVPVSTSRHNADAAKFEDDDLERMKQRVAARQEGSPLTY